MKKTKEFSDRRGNATDAKAAMLEKFRKAQAASAEGLEARLAERVAIAKAREERQAAREQEKRDEAQRILDEAAAAKAAEARRLEEEREAAQAHMTAHEKRIALVLSDEAARKALRDQRYAKRKAAQAGA